MWFFLVESRYSKCSLTRLRKHIFTKIYRYSLPEKADFFNDVWQKRPKARPCTAVMYSLVYEFTYGRAETPSNKQKCEFWLKHKKGKVYNEERTYSFWLAWIHGENWNWNQFSITIRNFAFSLSRQRLSLWDHSVTSMVAFAFSFFSRTATARLYSTNLST